MAGGHDQLWKDLIQAFPTAARLLAYNRVLALRFGLPVQTTTRDSDYSTAWQLT
ncbi:MAG: hypothetical protein ABJC13_19780 [Acidobacteriota bacterium]